MINFLKSLFPAKRRFRTSHVPTTYSAQCSINESNVKISALATDISKNGVRFYINDAKFDRVFIGDSITFSIRSPKKTLEGEGTVKWTSLLNGSLKFGVEITSDNKKFVDFSDTPF